MKRVSLTMPPALAAASTVCVKKLALQVQEEQQEQPEQQQQPTTPSNIKWICLPEEQKQEEQPVKKRVGSDTWNAESLLRHPARQLALLQELQSNHYVPLRTSPQFVHLKLLAQQLSKKLSGYKQQDLHKRRGEGFDADAFLSLGDVVDQLIACSLKCRYCTEDVFVLYDVSLESKQWTVDRVDNDAGHNRNNFHIACLQCNLQRRRRADDKYLFGKQMKLVKQNFLAEK